MLIVAALMAVSPAAGQKNLKDPKAVVGAMTEVIRKFDRRSVLPFADEIAERFKKDPYVLTGIGDAFWWRSGIKDSVSAYRFLRMSIEADPTYQPAYRLAGEIEDYWDNDSLAMEWYRRGIKADPKNPECYEACAKMMAKSNPDQILPTLLPMLEYDSTYQAHLKAARLYEDVMAGSNEMVQQYNQITMECYMKANPDSMTARDYAMYQAPFFATGRYGAAIAICDSGLKRHPESMTLLRNAMRACYNIEKNDSALMYGDMMFKQFNKVDSPRIETEDVRVYGIILQRKSKFDDAIARFREVLDTDDATDIQRSNALEHMAACYQEQGEYGQAEKVYLGYIEKREQDSTLTFRDLYLVANMYKSMADEANGQDKIDAYKKMFDIYTTIGEKFPERRVFSLFQRFVIAFNFIVGQDWNMLGDYIPLLEEIAAMAAEPNWDKENDSYLEKALTNMAVYYIKIDNYKKSLYYFKKVLEVNPENEQALKNVELLESIMGRRRR